MFFFFCFPEDTVLKEAKDITKMMCFPCISDLVYFITLSRDEAYIKDKFSTSQAVLPNAATFFLCTLPKLFI